MQPENPAVHVEYMVSIAPPMHMHHLVDLNIRTPCIADYFELSCAACTCMYGLVVQLILEFINFLLHTMYMIT